MSTKFKNPGVPADVFFAGLEGLEPAPRLPGYTAFADSIDKDLADADCDGMVRGGIHPPSASLSPATSSKVLYEIGCRPPDKAFIPDLHCGQRSRRRGYDVQNSSRLSLSPSLNPESNGGGRCSRSPADSFRLSQERHTQLLTGSHSATATARQALDRSEAIEGTALTHYNREHGVMWWSAGLGSKRRPWQGEWDGEWSERNRARDSWEGSINGSTHGGSQQPELVSLHRQPGGRVRPVMSNNGATDGDLSASAHSRSDSPFGFEVVQMLEDFANMRRDTLSPPCWDGGNAEWRNPEYASIEGEAQVKCDVVVASPLSCGELEGEPQFAVPVVDVSQGRAGRVVKYSKTGQEGGVKHASAVVERAEGALAVGSGAVGGPDSSSPAKADGREAWAVTATVKPLARCFTDSFNEQGSPWRASASAPLRAPRTMSEGSRASC